VIRAAQALHVLAVVLVATALAAPAASARPAASDSDATTVAALLRRQTTLFNAARWRALWATFTPRFRGRCAYRLWLAEQRALKQLLGGGKLAARNIRVRVSGRRAYASYVLVLGRAGRSVVKPPKLDLYVKVGSRWLDEGDRVTTCSSITA
jgi:hypothetical protein